MVIDIILAGVLLLGILIGYKQGFVNTFFGLIGGLLAIVLAIITYKPIAAIISPAWGWDTAVYNMISGLAEKAGGTDGVFSMLFGAITGTDVIVGQATNDPISTISTFIINMLVLFGLFIIYSIIILIVTKILNAIASLPIIEAINKLGGAVVGFVGTSVIVIVAFTILFFASKIGYGQSIVDMIDNSYASKYVYYNNIVVKVLVNNNFDLENPDNEETEENLNTNDEQNNVIQ